MESVSRLKHEPPYGGISEVMSLSELGQLTLGDAGPHTYWLPDPICDSEVASWGLGQSGSVFSLHCDV